MVGEEWMAGWTVCVHARCAAPSCQQKTIALFSRTKQGRGNLSLLNQYQFTHADNLHVVFHIYRQQKKHAASYLITKTNHSIKMQPIIFTCPYFITPKMCHIFCWSYNLLPMHLSAFFCGCITLTSDACKSQWSQIPITCRKLKTILLFYWI